MGHFARNFVIGQCICSAMAVAAHAQPITLSCDGVASHFFRPGKATVKGMSLVVDTASSSVVWNGTTATFSPGTSAQDNVLRFEWTWASKPRSEFTENDDIYSLNGSIDRVTGRATVTEARDRLTDAYPEETEYHLLCKLVKPLF